MSWNTAPPFGNAGSSLVSALMPIPPSNAAFGQTLSTITVPGCWPAPIAACSTTSPRLLPSRSRSPATTPSRAASAGCSIAVGRPSRWREVGVSVKLVFRNCRAGAVTMRNGWSVLAAS